MDFKLARFLVAASIFQQTSGLGKKQRLLFGGRISCALTLQTGSCLAGFMIRPQITGGTLRCDNARHSTCFPSTEVASVQHKGLVR